MAQRTGTYDIASLIAANNVSAIEYGVDNIAQILATDNANFSAQVTEALSDLASTTEDRRRLTGGSVSGDMQEVDEYSRGPTQKDAPGYFVDFPLRKYQFSVGWSKQWERQAKAADYAIRNSAAQAADLRRTRYELQKAIYTPTNYTFTDLHVDKVQLFIKAFINADGTSMQNGPNGEVFDGTSHTHYDGSATLTATAVQASITDVAEHRVGSDIRIFINQADAAAFSALSGFVPLQVPYVTLNQAANQATTRLQIDRLDNRQIGFFNAAQVWTKPYAVANYMIVADVAAPQKALVRRTEVGDRGLFIAAEIDTHPLRAEYAEHFYGFGAWNRTALAVLKFNNATYSPPTLSY